MNRAEIDRLIRDEVAGKKMIPTQKIPISAKPEFGGLSSEDEPAMKRIGENKHEKIIVVKDNVAFEVEIRRK